MERRMGSHSLVGRRDRVAFLRVQPFFGAVTFFVRGPGSPPLARSAVCEHMLCAASRFAGSESQNVPSSVQRDHHLLRGLSDRKTGACGYDPMSFI